MAKVDYHSDLEEEQTLAYDLRQSYAKIVGEQLEDIAETRKADNFHLYFRNLQDLFTIIAHKIKDEAEKTEYFNKEKEIITLANKHEEIWTGKSKEGNGFMEVDNKLRDLERYLYFLMDKYKMFGAKYEDEDDAL